jgi:hypothetical protein
VVGGMCETTSVFSYLYLDRKLNSAVKKASEGSKGGGPPYWLCGWLCW